MHAGMMGWHSSRRRRISWSSTLQTLAAWQPTTRHSSSYTHDLQICRLHSPPPCTRSTSPALTSHDLHTSSGVSTCSTTPPVSSPHHSLPCVVYQLHTHPFNGPLSGTTQVSRNRKDKTNLDFTEARDSEWQWHQLGHMQVCTSLQTDNHASTPPLSFFTGWMPFLPPNQQRQSTEGSCLSVNQVNILPVIAIRKKEEEIITYRQSFSLVDSAINFS